MLSLSDITYSLTAHSLAYSHMWGVDMVPEIRFSVVYLHANDCILWLREISIGKEK